MNERQKVQAGRSQTVKEIEDNSSSGKEKNWKKEKDEEKQKRKADEKNKVEAQNQLLEEIITQRRRHGEKRSFSDMNTENVAESRTSIGDCGHDFIQMPYGDAGASSLHPLSPQAYKSSQINIQNSQDISHRLSPSVSQELYSAFHSPYSYVSDLMAGQSVAPTGAPSLQPLLTYEELYERNLLLEEENFKLVQELKSLREQLRMARPALDEPFGAAAYTAPMKYIWEENITSTGVKKLRLVDNIDCFATPPQLSQALHIGNQPSKLVISLLDTLFTKEQLAKSNATGM
ncbi:hypothetical protein CHS0354_019098 [Potamilus streckersoni]|uniref:Uncharacterized protein n=1 Tax=Potamilus streckersoni TaxID=2493646 RepID=A0AAE0RQV3_9BIVA|nr:hypothetical protein CHS0354_019098 [Potamilus streckersoni]